MIRVNRYRPQAKGATHWTGLIHVLCCRAQTSDSPRGCRTPWGNHAVTPGSRLLAPLWCVLV